MGELIEASFGNTEEFLAYFVCAGCAYLFVGIAPRALDDELRARTEAAEDMEIIDSPFLCPHCDCPSCFPVWKDPEELRIVKFDLLGRSTSKMFPGK